MKFVLATHNPGKLKEMGEILSDLGVEVVSPADAGVTVDVEETGTTFAENAMLKAKAICAASGLPAIADDSGLCVDALNGGPGVYSARYGVEGLDDRGRYTLLLQIGHITFLLCNLNTKKNGLSHYYAKKEIIKATTKPVVPTIVSIMVQVLKVVFSSRLHRDLTSQKPESLK